jgi:hypothetical protein
MKLVVAGLAGLMLLASLSVGCGPGLSHRVQAPQPPTDAFNAMDAELAHAMTSTTTVTSAEPMPESRGGAAEAPQPAVAVAPTWGTGEAAPPAAAPSATNDFDMHPYD